MRWPDAPMQGEALCFRDAGWDVVVAHQVADDSMPGNPPGTVFYQCAVGRWDGDAFVWTAQAGIRSWHHALMWCRDTAYTLRAARDAADGGAP